MSSVTSPAPWHDCEGSGVLKIPCKNTKNTQQEWGSAGASGGRVTGLGTGDKMRPSTTEES